MEGVHHHSTWENRHWHTWLWTRRKRWTCMESTGMVTLASDVPNETLFWQIATYLLFFFFFLGTYPTAHLFSEGAYVAVCLPNIHSWVWAGPIETLWSHCTLNLPNYAHTYIYAHIYVCLRITEYMSGQYIHTYVVYWPLRLQAINIAHNQVMRAVAHIKVSKSRPFSQLTPDEDHHSHRFIHGTTTQ